MSGIVCAVRGGPASQPTIARAISLAKETGLPLHFVYIVNLDFLATAIMPYRPKTVFDELDQMGEFILLKTQSEAAQQGVTSHTVVRHGDVMEEVTALCREIEADYVILGKPKGGSGLLADEKLDEVQSNIEAATQAKVVWSEADSE